MRRFIKSFSVWLSTAHKNIVDSLTRSAQTYEAETNRLDHNGQYSEAENMREHRDETMEEAKMYACESYLNEFKNQYGETFVKRLTELAQDSLFIDFMNDIASTENMKSVTLDPLLAPESRLTPQTRTDRAIGCLIPLEIMRELAEKTQFVEKWKKELK